MAQPIFSSTTAGAPVGSANIESVSQAQTVKLCVEAPYFFFLSKNTKQLKSYLAKINIYKIHFNTHNCLFSTLTVNLLRFQFLTPCQTIPE